MSPFAWSGLERCFALVFWCTSAPTALAAHTSVVTSRSVVLLRARVKRFSDVQNAVAVAVTWRTLRRPRKRRHHIRDPPDPKWRGLNLGIGDWAWWEGSELNTQHRASYRNPGGRAPGWDTRVPCDGARTKERQPSEQSKSDSLGEGGVTMLRHCQTLRVCESVWRATRKGTFPPRKPSICTWRSGARFLRPPAFGLPFFFCALWVLNKTNFVSKMPRLLGGPRWKLHPSW